MGKDSNNKSESLGQDQVSELRSFPGLGTFGANTGKNPGQTGMISQPRPDLSLGQKSEVFIGHHMNDHCNPTVIPYIQVIMVGYTALNNHN